MIKIFFSDNLGIGRYLKIKAQEQCLTCVYVFIEQQHPFQIHTTHLTPHTPAHGIDVLTHHLVETLAALRHVQAQRQDPEQHQVREKV